MLFRSKDQAVKLLDLQSKFDMVQMTITFGKSKKTAKVDCCRLKWPRDPAAAFLISLKDVYFALGLSQFNGKSWRWINSGFANWMTMMADIGYSGHLVPSNQMDKDSFSDVVSQKVSK